MNICWAVYNIFNVGNNAVNQHILEKALLFIFLCICVIIFGSIF